MRWPGIIFLILVCCPGWFVSGRAAEGVLRPFVLADNGGAGDIAGASATVTDRLAQAGFEVIGQYAPYADSKVVVFTGPRLRELARQSRRGGYGAAMRVSLTRNGENLEIAYTNPVYWANAYRMQGDFDAVAKRLRAALGNRQEFGSGDLALTAQDLRRYHYTFMMEYFDDPSLLNYFENHQQAVAAVRAGLADGAAGASSVYELEIGNDVDGNPMTLFGVGLHGTDADDCSGDAYIMGRIDRGSPRHTAHLPYEILVYGNHAEALYARFRIAISWPHLPMLASDTGATFFSIMCAPGSIEKALTAVAGGTVSRAGDEK